MNPVVHGFEQQWYWVKVEIKKAVLALKQVAKDKDFGVRSAASLALQQIQGKLSKKFQEK